MDETEETVFEETYGKQLNFHAPTVTVALLRQAASMIEAAAEQLPGGTVFFPARVMGESQPVTLKGHVSLANIAGLVHYIADMLQV